MALHVVVLGPPASGKGTQAVRLAKTRGIPKVSTGDMLREAARAESELGIRAGALIDRGDLFGDAEMIGLVRERLSRPDAAGGFILDGFPRTVPQAEALDRMVPGGPLSIVNLAVPEAELIRRMQDRRVCAACAANAEPDDPNPRSKEHCARCDGQMITRADDADEHVRQHRLRVYAAESRPLLDYYRARPTFRSLNGAQAPDRVARELAASLDSMVTVAFGAHAPRATPESRRER